MEEQFPRKVWKLTPGYQPKEITITGSGKDYYSIYYLTDGGATIDAGDVWPTKADAIAAGHARLDKQLAALDKKKTNIDKRRAALERAAAS